MASRRRITYGTFQIVALKSIDIRIQIFAVTPP
jgi:hypothetical protein